MTQTSAKLNLLIALLWVAPLACAGAPKTGAGPGPVAEVAPTSATAAPPPTGPHQSDDWSRIGAEGGRVEMAAEGRVFIVATSTGLHLLEGEGCDEVKTGRLVRLDNFADGCVRNRMFDPSTHQTCLLTCRALAPPSDAPPAPRLGAVMAYAGAQGQYLVVQTFNGFRLFERQLGCSDDIPVGLDVQFETSPEGCISTTIRPPEIPGGPSCGLWCR